MEQEPGPPGCPQVPHGPAAAGASLPLDWAAKTESFLSSSLLVQRSQLGVSEERTSVSNSWPQARQAYSKIGMARFYSLRPVASSHRYVVSLTLAGERA